MNKNLKSVQMVFRSHVKSTLLFLLLVAVSFNFFSQAANYWVTRREINNAAAQYVGVGAVEASSAIVLKEPEDYIYGPLYIWTDSRVRTGIEPPDGEEYYRNSARYTPIRSEQKESIAELPYVTYTETRYLTAGISDRYERQEADPFYDFTSRNVLECTLESIVTEQNIGDYPAQLYLETRADLFNRINVRISDRVAGHIEWQMDDEEFCIQANPNRYKAGDIVTRMPCTVYTEYYTYDTEFISRLVPGHQYVFVTRDMIRWHDQNLKLTGDYYNFLLGDHFSDTWCPSVWDITGYGENWLDQPEFADLKTLIQMTNDDVHTWDVVYTNDMTSILRFAEGKMVILNGRALTPNDSGENICVINHVIASKYDLNIGDKITLALGKCLFEQYAELGAVACVPERYDSDRREVSLEIVGIYADTDGPSTWLEEPNWIYSKSTVFVPQSLLNVYENEMKEHQTAPGEFSFKVDNAWDISRFLQESAPQIEEMGLKLYFEDGGWSTVESSFRTAKTVTLIRMLLAFIVLLAATGVIIHIYTGRRKQEYAIMRAFGAGKGTARTAMLLPLGIMTVVAVLIGVLAAWRYSAKVIIPQNEVLSTLAETTADTGIPFGLVLGCMVTQVLLTMISAWIVIGSLSKRSPLELLREKAEKG